MPIYNRNFVLFIGFIRIKINETLAMFGAVLLNVFLAPVTLAKIAGKIYCVPENKPRWWPYAAVFIPLFVVCVMFCLLQMKYQWSWAIAFFIYLTFCGCAASVRMHARQQLNIAGHILEDFLACLFLYPSVVVQLEWTLEKSVGDSAKLKAQIMNNIL